MDYLAHILPQIVECVFATRQNKVHVWKNI